MVIYHAGYATYLPVMILHRLTIHKNDNAILLVSNGYHWSVTEKVPDVKQLEVNGIFDRVIYCDSFYALTNKASTVEKLESFVLTNFNTLFHKHEINLKDAKEIITSSDAEGEFSAYLSLVQQKYSFIEIAANHLYNAHNNHYISLEKVKPKVYSDFIKKHMALCAHSTLAKPILSVHSQKSKELYSFKENIDYFDYNDNLNNLSQELGEKILSAYKYLQVKPKSNNTCIVFLQNAVHVNMAVQKNDYLNKRYRFHQKQYKFNPRLDLSYYSNQLAMSYYLDEDCFVYLKPHPQNPMETNQALDVYGENIETLGNLPIDFYRFLPEEFKYRYSSMLTYGSTTNSKMGDIFDHSYVLTYDYWSSFYLYHKLYATVALLQDFIVDEYTMSAYGLKASQLELLANRVCGKGTVMTQKEKLKFSSREISVINTLSTPRDHNQLLNSLLQAPKNTIISFIDHATTPFYESQHRELMDFVIPIVIKKKQVSENCLDPLDDELLYIFCKDTLIREKLEAARLKKNLHRAGLELTIQSITGKDKALLLSTIERRDLEQKVNEYKMEQQSLQQQINDYKAKNKMQLQKINQMMEQLMELASDLSE